MPNHETLDAYCRSLPYVTAASPFGPDNVVYKVGGKMFALLSLELARINLKCDPERAERLRESSAAVEPGYHMNKRHWNSVYWDRDIIAEDELLGWVRHAYALVWGGLTAKLRTTLPQGAAVDG